MTYNHQQTMFDFDAKPLARSSDPETSKEAAREAAPNLGRCHRTVIAAMEITLTERDDATARELAKTGHTLSSCTIEHETLRKRVRELVVKGVFEEVGVRQCLVSGKKVTTFRSVK